MARILTVIFALLMSGGIVAPSLAADADLGVIHHPRRTAQACPLVKTCADGVCDVRHVCRPLGCPDGYGCYPLYGAYGPYGGTAYWSSLSYR